MTEEDIGQELGLKKKNMTEEDIRQELRFKKIKEIIILLKI